MQLYRTNPRGLTFQIRCCLDSQDKRTTITLCRSAVSIENQQPATTDRKIITEVPMHDVILKWALWRNGKLIQDAFPEFSDSEREFLVSGLDENEWRRIFGPDLQRARSINNT